MQMKTAQETDVHSGATTKGGHTRGGGTHTLEACRVRCHGGVEVLAVVAEQLQCHQLTEHAAETPLAAVAPEPPPHS